MAKIIVTGSAGVVLIEYNTMTTNFKARKINVANGMWVGLMKDDDAVVTNLFCNEIQQFDHSEFDTIGGTDITTNPVLFTELGKMLT